MVESTSGSKVTSSDSTSMRGSHRSSDRRTSWAIRPAVVRVLGLGDTEEWNVDPEKGVGTGVVIVEKGIILTNLHVVFGARRIKVIFADGLEADADVIALRPEHDLAVLRARSPVPAASCRR